MTKDVGVLSLAYSVPGHKRAVRDLILEEGAEFTPEVEARLGIEEVHLCEGESGSALALQAAQEAIQRAGLKASEIDVIIEYSVLPQEYLVPAWNMSNKLQHELGAEDAFTLGFSGGGATNFLVALNAATALIQSDQNINTALLVAADVTIPANRILNPEHPITALGDCASAVIVQGGVHKDLVLDTELWSDGRLHDACFIRGGALAHPDRPDLYRLRLDLEKYNAAPKLEVLGRLTHNVLKRTGVRLDQVSYFLYPNICAADQASFMETFGLKAEQLNLSNRTRYGHMQGNDFVLNALSALESDTLREGDYLLMSSHGMGFLSGVTLMRH